MRAKFAIFLICFLYCVSPICSQDQPLSLKSIAGRYYAGDGKGHNLTLTINSDGTYSFDGHGDLPDQPGNSLHGEGQIELAQNGHLILKQINTTLFFKWPDSSTGKLLPVKWGERLYLVNDQDCSEFCSDINTGLEPRDRLRGEEYIRYGDETKAVSGMPNLPAKWQALILKSPLQGSVTKLLANNRCQINLGQQEGVKKGLSLFAWNKDLAWVKSHPNPNYPEEKTTLAIKAPIAWITGLTVLSVTPHTCIAQAEDLNPKYNHLAIGQSVTSR